MSTTKVKQKREVEVVVFEDPAKRKNSTLERPSHSATKTTRPDSQQEVPRKMVFDQKKAKYEVRKLGIYGMDKKKKDEAMVEYLVELGARRPRNKCYHYKEFQEMQKKKREEEKKVEEMERKAGITRKKPQKKRKRDKDDILGGLLDGEGGFKEGVQFVKKSKR